MTIYYRDESLRVTARQIQTVNGVYPLAELDDVWLEHGPWQPERAAGILLLRLLVALAGLALAGAVVAVVVDVHHPGGDLVPTWVVYGFLFASPVVLGVLIRYAEKARDGGTRTLLLCARWRGRSVTLYATTNPTRFGQVHRAVQRALENGGGWDY
jgi:hypothetical protein